MTALASASTPADAAKAPVLDLRVIPLDEIHESPENPRTHYDQALLAELAESLKATGQLTPALARPRKKGGFELAAGHRRFRAAKLAGIEGLICSIRTMDDKTFLEVLTIENLQRDDLHPLEEAQGYASLMKTAGYDVAKIATRIGKSIKYVYDRVKLLQLNPRARKLFLDGKIEAGHAIILARLASADQDRVMGREEGDEDIEFNGLEGGLFTHESAESLFAGGDDEADDEVKPVSVRELQSYINKHVRLDHTVADLPDLFPDAALAIRDAQEMNIKLVYITYDSQVHPEAKKDGQRIYGPASWKRADGTKAFDPDEYKQAQSKGCADWVMGFVAVGPDRGQAFKVCVAKKKCEIHWPAPKKAKAGKGSSGGGWEERERKRQEQYHREEAERLEKGRRWMKAAPAIVDAFVKVIKTASAGSAGPLAAILRNQVNHRTSPLPIGKTAEDLVRCLVAGLVKSRVNNQWSGPREGPALGKALGVDVAKVFAAAAPKPKASADNQAPAKKKSAGKKAVKLKATKKAAPRAKAKKKSKGKK